MANGTLKELELETLRIKKEIENATNDGVKEQLRQKLVRIENRLYLEKEREHWFSRK